MKTKLTIGIDARTFAYSNSVTRGIGNYTLNHLSAVVNLMPEWNFIVYYDYLESFNIIEKFLTHSNVKTKRFIDYEDGEIDLLHIPDPMNTSPGFDSPFRILHNLPLSVLFHDLIPLYFYYDGWSQEDKNLYDLRLEQLKKTNSLILTNSNYTKEDLIYNTGISSDRVIPVWAGLNRIDKTKEYNENDFILVQKKFGINKPYFIFVGALDEHKNFEATLKAFTVFSRKHASQLVVVGKKDGKTKVWEEVVSKKKINGVVFTGYVTRDELEILYGNAISLLFLSRFEGFGFPVLEAMANGCPVISSNLTSLSEVAGNAAKLVNPDNLLEVVEAMQNFSSNDKLRESFIRAGYDRSKIFTWEFSAKRTVNAWCDKLGIKPIFEDAEDTTDILKFTKSPGSSKQNELQVIWQSPIFDVSGYADEARNFVLGLNKLGINVKVVSRDWTHIKAKLPEEDQSELVRLSQNYFTNLKNPRINIIHSFPNNFHINRRASYNIGRTMFETDRIPDSWVEQCNKMDEIWVPSKFNLETFTNSGVSQEKLFKIPEAIDTDLFTLEVPKLKEITNVHGFKFLSVFDWNLRKGWDVLIRAFAEEFAENNNIKLILKVWSSYGLSLEEIQEELKEFVERNKLNKKILSRIIFYPKNLPNNMLPSLYKSVDAFVLPTRGEGWGRPIMEAMTMQIPAIATRCSGQLEFMNDDNSFLIDCKYIDVPEKAVEEIPNFRGHKWAEPSVQHLKKLMHTVYKDYKEAFKKAKTAREFILKNFNRKTVAKIAHRRLEEIHQKIKDNSYLETSDNTNEIVSPEQSYVINWNGEFDGKSSLSIVNINLAHKIENLGVQINKGDNFKYSGSRNEITVSHNWPPDFIPPKSGYWVVIQPWEFGSIPTEWLHVFNKLTDAVWVPSKYVKDIYVEGGVKKDKIFIVPNGVDTSKFNKQPAEIQLKTKKKHKFLFVGGTIYRKGIDLLLKAYTEEFTRDDDVVLIIKDMGGSSFYSGQTYAEQIKVLSQDDSMPEIEYIDEFLAEEELKALYQIADVLVYPYRGEGFGLPILESMACGTPAIVPESGAATDFCKYDNSFLIHVEKVFYKEKRVGELQTVNHPWLYEVSINDLKQKMRFTVDFKNVVKAKGEKAYEFVHANFTWENSAVKAFDSISLLFQTNIQRYENNDAILYYLEKTFSLIDLNERDKALKYLDTTIDLIENANHKSELPLTLDELLVVKAKIYLSMNEIETARINFEKALNVNPTSSLACAGLGEIFYLSKMFEEAKTMYEWAVINDVNNSEAQQKLKKINKILKLPETHNSVLIESETSEKIQSQG